MPPFCDDTAQPGVTVTLVAIFLNDLPHLPSPVIVCDALPDVCDPMRLVSANRETPPRTGVDMSRFLASHRVRSPFRHLIKIPRQQANLPGLVWEPTLTQRPGIGSSVNGIRLL